MPSPRARDIAQRHDLIVVEDAAHAVETVYKGRKVGTISTLTSFSFYVTKNIVTGEGGMVTTNNPDFADRIKMYALHGMSRDAWRRYSDDGFKHYQVVFPGFKYNMMDLQAAIGIHQMDRVDSWLARRNVIWARYEEAFANLPVGRPLPAAADTVHARHLYTLMIDRARCGISRDEFMDRMHQLNIGTGVYYVGFHHHTYYNEKFCFTLASFHNTTWLIERTVSLPLSPKLSDADVEDVIAAVHQLLA